MTGLGPESKAVLDAARQGDDPTEADRERVRAAIASRLAAGAAAGLGLATAARSSTAALRAGLAAKALVGVALVCAIGASAVMLARTSPSPAAPAVGVAAPPPAPIAPPALAPTDTSDGWNGSRGPATPGGLHPTARVAPVAASAAASARSAPATADVAAEVRLLGEAHTAMRGGQAEQALVLLDEHARRYPKGALGEERDAARVAALCALGRTSEAREATDRFLRSAPRSPLAGPVRASCGATPATPAP